MAKGKQTNNPVITASPSVQQLQTAKMVCINVNATATGANLAVMLFPNISAEAIISVWDGGNKNMSCHEIVWNKANGTITINSVWADGAYTARQITQYALWF